MYEGGATDRLFYQKVFKEKWLKKVPLTLKEMGSGGNFNKIAARNINDFLKEDKSKSDIHVFVAFDRDGARDKQPLFDKIVLENGFKNGKRKIKIYSIIATQDIESWFFY